MFLILSGQDYQRKKNVIRFDQKRQKKRGLLWLYPTNLIEVQPHEVGAFVVYFYLKNKLYIMKFSNFLIKALTYFFTSRYMFI